MKVNRYNFAVLAAVVSLAWSAVAFAQGDGRTCPGNTPIPNGAFIASRVFNDCPISNYTVTNAYPALIHMHDTMDPNCVGFTNLHT